MTPANCTGTFRCPASLFDDFSGCVEIAFTPIFSFAMSCASRMHPFTTTPAHPFVIAIAAKLSPSNAHRREPPPSITKTLPVPGSFKASRTNGLFSKHLIVTAGPLNLFTPRNREGTLAQRTAFVGCQSYCHPPARGGTHRRGRLNLAWLCRSREGGREVVLKKCQHCLPRRRTRRTNDGTIDGRFGAK